MNIPIVYEDDTLVVVEKPAGLLVIPTPKKESRTLTSILGLYPCHRLDRETSGLIIYAKGKAAQKKMMRQFHLRRVKKTYVAFVQGRLPKRSGEIRTPIEGKEAVTLYKAIAQERDFAVVEASALTGRTNQLRIHFKRIGHPIVGESKFCFRRDFKLRFKRLCLHAKSLQFSHPLSGKIISLNSGLPADLKGFLNKQAKPLYCGRAIAAAASLAAFLLFVRASFAENVSPSAIQRSQEIIRQEEALRQKVTQERKFFVERIILKGMPAALSEKEKNAITAPYEGEWVTEEEIRQLIEALRLACAAGGISRKNIEFSYEFKEGAVLEITAREKSQ